MDEVVANIRSALISTKGSSSLHQLQRDYREIVGEFIPFKKFGFMSLESFLNSVPSLRVSKHPDGLITVDAVATDNVKHIVSLVNKQKTSKKKVGYVASRFRPSGYQNRSPSYSNRPSGYVNRSPGYAGQPKRRPRFEAPFRPKESKFAVPKPVGNKRRLSVFERLGPKISSEENLSTFDEDEDEFVSKFQSTRQVTRMPKGKMSLPANIKITSPFKTSSKDPQSSSSSTSDLESQTWTDAATVLKKDELTNQMSRLSLMRERINSRNPNDDDFPTGRISTSFAGNIEPGLVFNNNLPVPNNNAPSDLDRPRMRTQPNLGATSSISGATRPRPAFISPPVFATPTIRPVIPRFNQNRFVSSVRLPWQPQEKKVVMIETSVDHRIRKVSQDSNKPSSDEELKIIDPLRLHHLVSTLENETNDSEIARPVNRLSNTNVPSLEFKIEDPSDRIIFEPLTLNHLIGNLKKPANEESNSNFNTIKRWSDFPSKPFLFKAPEEETNILDVKKMEPVKSKIPKLSDIPKLKEFLDVKISHVFDPYCFFVQPIKSSPILNSLMGKIQGKYSGNPSQCNFENIFINEFYALKHQDQFWYRVKVTNFVARDQVTVFFCDFGYQVIVSVTELVTLEPEFYEVPFQAIKSKLIGIRPNNCTWTLEETQYFTNRVLEKPYVSLVTSVDDGEELLLGLKLFDTTGDDDVNIGREMVENNVAQYDLDV